MTSRAQDVAHFLSLRFEHLWPSLCFFDLQRLLYLAQGWHLAGGRGVLFVEPLVAHRAAPMVPSVKGLFPLAEMLPKPNLTQMDMKFLDTFCYSYGKSEPTVMRRQVEAQHSAWNLALSVNGEGSLISLQSMESAFRLSLFNFAENALSKKRLGPDEQSWRTGTLQSNVLSLV